MLTFFSRSIPKDGAARARFFTALPSGELPVGRMTVAAEDEVIEGGQRLIVATTADVDRYDDIVDQETLIFANWVKALAPMLYGHDYGYGANGGVVIGRAKPGSVAISDVKGKKCMVLEPEWDVAPDNPIGTRVARQWGKFIKTVSIGFRPGRVRARTSLEKDHYAYQEKGWGLFFEDCEILEVSVVPVPANPFAMDVGEGKSVGAKSVTAARTGPITPDDLADELVEAFFARLFADKEAMARLADEIGRGDPPAGAAGDAGAPRTPGAARSFFSR